jgi:hypothetical protein
VSRVSDSEAALDWKKLSWLLFSDCHKVHAFAGASGFSCASLQEKNFLPLRIWCISILVNVDY